MDHAFCLQTPLSNQELVHDTKQLQRINQLSSSGRFTPCDKTTVFRPGSVYWLRFKPDAFPANRVIGLQNAQSAALTLFTPASPAAERGLASTYSANGNAFFLFPFVRLPENRSGPAFSFLAVTVGQPVSSRALRLYGTAAFDRLTWQYVLALGLAFGGLAAATAYALACWFIRRQKQQLLYLTFLLSLLCYQLADSGILWLLAPPAASVFYSLTTIMGYVVLICSAAFSRFFLETERHAPRTDLLIRLCPFMLLGGLACILLGAPRAASYVGYTTAMLLLLFYAAGTLAALRGKLPGAGYYLTAWIFLLAGVLLAFSNNLFLLSHAFILCHIQLFAAVLAGIPLSLSPAVGSALVSLEQHNPDADSARQPVHITDELTGLYNKHFFNSSLESAIEYSKLTGSPLSLLMLNVDNFRRFYETFGPPQAEKVLSTLGELIRKGIRAHDVPCRFNNEEFAIILPGATENDAMHAAERFRKAFANLFFHPDPTIRVNSTLSFGVATYASDDTASTVFERAGQALYQAKMGSKDKRASAEQN